MNRILSIVSGQRRVAILVFIMSVLLFLTVFMPITTHATGTIIPCGNSNTSLQNEGKEGACTLRDLITFVSNFIKFALEIMVAVATLAFLYAGYLYLTSGAVPEQRSQAKGMFVNILWGFFWVIASYFLVKFIVTELVSSEISNQFF